MPAVSIGGNLTTTEEMWQTELRYRALLRGRSLVLEAEVPGDEAKNALGALGRKYFLQDSAADRRSTLAKYRGHLLIGLVAVGADQYEDGTLWPHIENAFGDKLSQTMRDEISNVWSEILDSMGLARFQTPMRIIGEFLMHGGVPTTSTCGLVDALTRLDGLLPNMQAGQFIHRITALSGEDAYHSFGISRPAWRFLKEGGDIATDFVARALTAIDALNEDSDSADAGGLPQSTFEAMRACLTRSGSSARSGGSSKKRPRRLNLTPALIFQEQKGVRIQLPPLEVAADADIHWRLNFGGESGERLASRPFPGDGPSTTFWNVDRPVGGITLTASAGASAQGSWALTLVDPEDPLIIFDAETSVMLRANSLLPKDRVWLGYPVGADVNPLDEELEIDGTIKLVSDEITIYGWDGWAFRLADLTDVKRLRLSDDARKDLEIAGSSPWRYISTTSKPRIEGITEVPFVAVPGTRYVSSTVPLITIPGIGGSSTDLQALDTVQNSPAWTVYVKPIGSDENLYAWAIYPDVEDASYALWPDDRDPVVGVFDVELVGALGKGFKERVAIFEGLDATSTVERRHLIRNGSGIERAKVTVALSSLNDSAVVELDQLSTENRLDTIEALAEFKPIVEVPYASITKRLGHLASTTLTPAICEFENLIKTTITVNESIGNRFCKLVSVDGSGIEQDVLETSRTESSVTFNLAQLIDSLEQSRNSELFIESNNDRTLVGRVQPHQLARGVSLTEDGRLKVDARSAIPGLEAAVYPAFAPWANPLIVDLDAKLVSEPLDVFYAHSKSAYVALAIRNPWTPTEWELADPKPSPNIFEVTTLPLMTSGAFPHELERWLAGESAEPGLAPSKILIETYARLGPRRRAFKIPFAKTPLDVARAIADQEIDFLAGINEASISNRAQTKLLVESGLIASIRAEIGAPVTLWERQPTTALIAKAGFNKPDFGYRSAREEAFGNVAAALANGDEDPHAKTGAFLPPHAMVFDAMHKDQLNAVMRAAKPIPGRLLDQDERMIHARELFDARHEQYLAPLCRQSGKILKLIMECIEEQLGTDGLKPIKARTSNEGWMSLPALTIALALINRLAARNVARAKEISAVTINEYAKLANVAPLFVEQDIVLAELWLSGWEEPNGSN